MGVVVGDVLEWFRGGWAEEMIGCKWLLSILFFIFM
jgi:hypothetical protein